MKEAKDKYIAKTCSTVQCKLFTKCLGKIPMVFALAQVHIFRNTPFLHPVPAEF